MPISAVPIKAVPINGVDIITAYRDYEQKAFVESLLQIPSVGAKLFREQCREQTKRRPDRSYNRRIACLVLGLICPESGISLPVVSQ